ncbi:MAG: zinc-binding dehydrogenase [Granulosicoccaceae bacterium]
MVALFCSTVIRAPIDVVWPLLRDFNAHERWHPAVDRSDLEADRQGDQVGSIRNFYLTSNEHLREQLLSLSDKDHQLRYTIVESDIPLTNYVAEISLKSINDVDHTLWCWHSNFDAPPGQEQELKKRLAENVYAAGFDAIRARVEPMASRPSSIGILRSDQTPAAESGPTAYRRKPPPFTIDPFTVSQSASNSLCKLEGYAMMMDKHGTPDVLRRVPTTAPSPGPGQVRLRQTAIGLNFIDIYYRRGNLDALSLPAVPGMEAAGVVESVGSGITQFEPGQRVAYACLPMGAYTSVRTMDAALMVPLPDHIDDITAAAGLLKGVSALYLVQQVHRVKRGETVLVYAPAGGVGRLLCQWARHIGATVIGVTSTKEKCRIAKAAGVQHVILPGKKKLPEHVNALTNGRGVDVIFDAVGHDSFDESLAALAIGGHLVSYGQASGDIGSKDMSSLAEKSATLSRPNFVHYTDTHEKITALSNQLFDVIKQGVLTIEMGQKYALSQVADAHRALENRETTASSALIPD